jgi:hypothetical protein
LQQNKEAFVDSKNPFHVFKENVLTDLIKNINNGLKKYTVKDNFEKDSYDVDIYLFLKSFTEKNNSNYMWNVDTNEETVKVIEDCKVIIKKSFADESTLTQPLSKFKTAID